MSRRLSDEPSIRAERCVRCGKHTLEPGCSSVGALGPELRTALEITPDENPEGHVCRACHGHGRAVLFRSQLTEERGVLGELEREIARRAAHHVAIATDLDKSFEARATRADRLADGLARVGGSWAFVLGFFAVLGSWLLINGVVLSGRAFDPYPFILLNLILSCLAAIQAPIILMSQNRASLRDRAQANEDYRVNLKAELEVAGLHEKLDLLLHHKWETLLSLQDAQTELLEELLARLDRFETDREPAGPGSSGAS